MMRAPINKIIPFSSVDGPGNRTSIFLQGCNLNCKYCHNPETIHMCIHCGDCVKTCPTGALSIKNKRVVFDFKKCIACDTCIKVCSHGASPRIRLMSPEEVFAEIEKQMPFIRGITTSGGECSLYPLFLKQLFTLCKKDHLGTLIDSNGMYDFSRDEKLLSVSDGVMLDIKAWNIEDHMKVTDKGNSMILKNLEYLSSVNKLYEVRTVVVPELFDVKETVSKVSEIISKKSSNIRYKIITYRPMGVRDEYKNFIPPTKQFMKELYNIAKGKGVKEVIIV